MGRLWYRWPLARYDRAYRWAHGLDPCAARIGPIIRLEQQRQRGEAILSDGTAVRRGDLIGVIHLDNAAVAALHAGGRNPQAIGLEFRRQLVTSLRELAVLASHGGPLSHLNAFAATTIFLGLRRLGFERTRGPIFPRLVGAYQRALLSWLHPAGRSRSDLGGHPSAQRLAISRQELILRYAQPDIAIRAGAVRRADVRRAAASRRALSGSPRRASEPS
jgi:YkoP domain